ncbi:uncharacterized protein FIESC28_08178 [Fusarium coffeatum]|uniref:PA14 domain-containing protein n=1 Tax=Fusarium coffeatum TaxID=231269 RepID=A0A366RA93_9HYPO|nr:uncharacterized protein FIESC28_08178 [Fusarium coffeatum]RBR13478.1 hypothetical protein FIESC28_08178 [Fusarium coffeatum]
MKSKALLSVLAFLSASTHAGPCKPITSQTTQAASATTEGPTTVDSSTTIMASDTTEVPHPSTTELSSQTTEEPTVSLTTTIAADTTSEAPTSTEEASTTGAAACPTPVSCDNLGFDWAYYSNPAQNTDATYSSFVPQSFKSRNPLYFGTTRQIGGLYQPGNGAQDGPIYGSSIDLSLNYFALNHHTYLYACEAGTYKFDIPYANDALYFWIGAKAYAGWTSGNADAKALYDQPDHIAGSASYEVDLPGGVYIPLRFVYGQAQYGGGFTFTVTSPSGQVLVGDDVASSPYVVRYSCDGVTAPQYPPFGQEN